MVKFGRACKLMRGIVIMKKTPLLGKPRISFESQIRQLKYEQSSLPLATCFQWSLWHVSSPSPLKGFSYLNVAICIPPSQYNNRISHGSSMWNFKFNRSQQKQQQSQWSRRHLQSANLCCWWVEDYWVKSALKCGRLSLYCLTDLLKNSAPTSQQLWHDIWHFADVPWLNLNIFLNF